jgi:hypothetical protein
MSIEEDFETIDGFLGSPLPRDGEAQHRAVLFSQRDAAKEALGRVIANYRAKDSALDDARAAAVQVVNLLRPLLCVLVLALAGCATPTSLDLDPRWQPLTKMVVGASTPSGVFQTVCPYVYCHAISDFTSADAVQQEGLLKHEQLHAIRQTDPKGPGQAYWQARYDSDMAFRLAEEQVGFKAQLLAVKAGGESSDVNLVASIMSGPTYADPAGNPMVSYDAAVAWINGVLAGTQ